MMNLRPALPRRTTHEMGIQQTNKQQQAAKRQRHIILRQRYPVDRPFLLLIRARSYALVRSPSSGRSVFGL